MCALVIGALAADARWAESQYFGRNKVQLDLVKPMDRPRKGWHWQFDILPGF